MLPTPTKYTLITGSGRGRTRLNAFDRALMAAGIGNLNLIKVSSILPPGTEFADRLAIPPGSLTPIAYGAMISDQAEELIAASVGVGVGEHYGMIMEYSSKCSREEAEATVRSMVEEAFRDRGLELRLIRSAAVERRVEDTSCVFAGAVLWY
ncbi:MAG: pyruvoyl-dependent arginine decarboxylase [Chloroflexota bacterium]